MDELLALNRSLLECIAAGDWDTYAELCDPSLTCFEPEARGHLVEGMDFHRFYFEQLSFGKTVNTTMAAPHVRMLGSDAAVVCCVRLVQKMNDAGQPVTTAVEETRLWQRQQGKWKHVHFHRSLPS